MMRWKKMLAWLLIGLSLAIFSARIVSILKHPVDQDLFADLAKPYLRHFTPNSTISYLNPAKDTNEVIRMYYQLQFALAPLVVASFPENNDTIILLEDTLLENSPNKLNREYNTVFTNQAGVYRLKILVKKQ